MTTLLPVAVCVPAHGDAAPLQRLLESLQRVDYPRELMQVVVAVDGPDHELEAVARRYATDVLVSPVNRGSYAMRNLAIEAVRDAALVLFTDSDCIVTPDWVRAHVEGIGSFDLAGGPVRFTMHQPPTPAEWVDSCRSLRQEHFVHNVGYAATCNLAVRRHVLDSVRFDDQLRSGGDFDFGRRTAAAGFTLGYTRAAAIEHPARGTAREVLRKTWRVAGGARDLRLRSESATRRRDASRRRAATAARADLLPVSAGWLLRAAALDHGCSLLFAARVPDVIAPKLRRALTGRA